MTIPAHRARKTDCRRARASPTADGRPGTPAQSSPAPERSQARPRWCCVESARACRAIRLRSRTLSRPVRRWRCFYTFYFAKAVLIPIALAMLLNLLLAPVVRGLKRYLRLPHGVGAALVLLLGVAVVGRHASTASRAPRRAGSTSCRYAMIRSGHKVEELRRPVDEVQEAAQRVENLAQGAPEAGEQQPVQVAVAGPGLTQIVPRRRGQLRHRRAW